MYQQIINISKVLRMLGQHGTEVGPGPTWDRTGTGTDLKVDFADHWWQAQYCQNYSQSRAFTFSNNRSLDDENGKRATRRENYFCSSTSLFSRPTFLLSSAAHSPQGLVPTISVKLLFPKISPFSQSRPCLYNTRGACFSL